jgi:hypothetical protein
VFWHETIRMLVSSALTFCHRTRPIRFSHSHLHPVSSAVLLSIASAMLPRTNAYDSTAQPLKICRHHQARGGCHRHGSQDFSVAQTLPVSAAR